MRHDSDVEFGEIYASGVRWHYAQNFIEFGQLTISEVFGVEENEIEVFLDFVGYPEEFWDTELMVILGGRQ